MDQNSVRRLDDHFLAQLDEVDLWLRERGIRKENRFRRYKRNFEWLRNHDRPEDRGPIFLELDKQGRLTEILSTFVESMEIADTIPLLRQMAVEIPSELLRRAFSGPADAFQENERSNQARNAMFELSMGAMIARRGLSPTFSDSNPDIAFSFGDRSVKMECKRVISESKIIERIEEGIRQLDRSVQANNIGIVAISLSRLFNPGDRVPIVAKSTHPHDVLCSELHGALKRMERQLSGLARPAVTAVLFYISSPFYVPDLGYTRQTCAELFPMNSGETPFLQQLAGSFTL